MCLVQFYYDLYAQVRAFTSVWKKTFEDRVQQRERIGQVVVLLLTLRGDYWLVYADYRVRTEETSFTTHTDTRARSDPDIPPTPQLRSADTYIVLNQDNFGLFPWRLSLRRGSISRKKMDFLLCVQNMDKFL